MVILHGIQKKGLWWKGDGKENEFEQFHVHKLKRCFKSMPLFHKKKLSIYSTN